MVSLMEAQTMLLLSGRLVLAFVCERGVVEADPAFRVKNKVSEQFADPVLSKIGQMCIVDKIVLAQLSVDR